MLTEEYYMTGNAPAMATPPAIQEVPETETLDTRFGKITVNRKNPITFPNGMLGVPDRFLFCLTSFPSEKLARFKLLQSLDEAELSFIMLPIEIDNPIIARDDIEIACRELEMPIESLALLLVVTVNRQEGEAKLSVNARAPVMMNAANRQAAQYVFHNPKYLIRQPISLQE